MCGFDAKLHKFILTYDDLVRVIQLIQFCNEYLLMEQRLGIWVQENFVMLFDVRINEFSLKRKDQDKASVNVFLDIEEWKSEEQKTKFSLSKRS